MKKTPMAFKLNTELTKRLKAATKGHYAPTMTAILERGIELALRELEKKHGPK